MPLLHLPRGLRGAYACMHGRGGRGLSVRGGVGLSVRGGDEREGGREGVECEGRG